MWQSQRKHNQIQKSHRIWYIDPEALNNTPTTNHLYLPVNKRSLSIKSSDSRNFAPKIKKKGKPNTKNNAAEASKGDAEFSFESAEENAQHQDQTQNLQSSQAKITV